MQSSLKFQIFDYETCLITFACLAKFRLFERTWQSIAITQNQTVKLEMAIDIHLRTNRGYIIFFFSDYDMFHGFGLSLTNF